MPSRRAQKNIILLIALVFAILIMVDRYYWAQIAQWREDQATNLWLGYTAGIGSIPVGLISSKSVPNPNGMVLLGSLLSLLPNLLWVSLFFVSLSFAISTWMDGPDWLAGERPDQIVQFLPMFLLFIFLLPVVIKVGGRAGRAIAGISYFLLVLFVTVNLLCGFMIIVRDQLRYHGDVLTEADISLVDKEQAVEFIASDWKAHSPIRTIPVDYDLGGGRWDWVPEFGNQLTKWYPAPMTDGRSFDYELLHSYGLMNAQEGVQHRTFGTGRYLLTYAFENPPQVSAGRISHMLFGRLRVSVVDQQ